MYFCKTCCHRSRSLTNYVEHCRLHFNEANVQFPCAFKNCPRRFRTYNAFKSHVSRDHESTTRKRTSVDRAVAHSFVKGRCPLNFCAKILASIQDLLGHLKDHIAQGTEVTCPFQGCILTFKVKSSFTSHLSRRHRSTANRQLSSELLVRSQTVTNEENNSSVSVLDSELNRDVVNESSQDQQNANSSESDDETSAEENTELFVKNLALFYLRLYAKHHVPASTVQTIIEEMQATHSISQNYVKRHVRSKLIEMSVGEEVVEQVAHEFIPSDIFSSVHSDKGLLSTEYRRKQYFKTHLSYVAPITINLGFDNNNVKRQYEYIPIIETIQELMKDQSVKSQFENPIISTDGVLRDFMDGNIAKNNILFIQFNNAIKLILYQDSFEVVNPLGSAKRKHKILAVYVTLGNIYPCNRSKIDQMQLVLLVRDVDFKHFGHEAVFCRLISDLKKIEEEGVLVDGEYIKGTIAMILGDNLGSHCVGGFVENFSSCNFVCRFCLIETNNIELGDVYDTYAPRSPDSYNADLDNLENSPGLSNYHGIKFNSLFNKLKYYHVCNPGLPPCLGHDLFEGVVQYDLALFINYMVKVNKWFTYAQFNQIVTKFKYLGGDVNNKPSTISDQGSKLGGHAVQNWCLVRLLPILIGARVASAIDPVWQLTLLLREIVELVCAPEITLPQVACLRVKIEEYLEQRVSLFPDKPVRPKHHYLAHYPRLILQFGPLIRVWTMRFESKHSYFKKCARYSQNFINICHTFAERHQLLQAYLSDGSLFSCDSDVVNAISFNADLYNDKVKDAFYIHHSSAEDVVTSSVAVINGIEYKKDLFVVVANGDYSLTLGQIVMIFQHKDNNMCLLVNEVAAQNESEMGYYKIEWPSCTPPSFTCVRVSDLKSHCCLPSYKVGNEHVIVLKHALLP